MNEIDKRKIRRIRRPKNSGKITWAAARKAVCAAKLNRMENKHNG